MSSTNRSASVLYSWKKVAHIVLLCILVLLILLLTGCSPAAPGIDKIKSDVQNQYAVLKERNMTITSFQIEKRQTDVENKRDIVYIALEASGDGFTFNAKMQAVYRLYNEGWLLDYVSSSSAEYMPTRGVDEARPSSEYPNKKFEMNLLDRYTDLQNGTDTFYFSIGYTARMYKATGNYTFLYQWNKHSGSWELESSCIDNEYLQFIAPENGNSINPSTSSRVYIESAEYVNDTKLAMTLERSVSNYSNATEIIHVEIYGGWNQTVYSWVKGDWSNSFDISIPWYDDEDLRCRVVETFGGSYYVYLN